MEELESILIEKLRADPKALSVEYDEIDSALTKVVISYIAGVIQELIVREVLKIRKYFILMMPNGLNLDALEKDILRFFIMVLDNLERIIHQ